MTLHTGAPVKADVSFLVSEYLNYTEHIERVATKTLLNRRHILVPFFRELHIQNVEQVTLYDIDRYFMAHTNFADSTITTTRRNIRLFFQWCHEYKEINLAFKYEAIKCRKYKPKKTRVFSREEVARVVAATPHMQDKLIITLMFETGMRIGEVIGLQVHHINGLSISIRGKGGTQRVVIMPPDLARTLQEHMPPEGYVFRPLQHGSDRYISCYGVRGRIQRAFTKCGFTMHPHQLRHSFEVDWLQRGGDIRTLQLLLGHESIETTQWYLHLTDSHLLSNYLQNRSESFFA